MSLPVLQRGSTGQAVRLWQHFLNQQGIRLDIASQARDGIFGPGTERGTREYQVRKGLLPTGIVDSQTYAKAMDDQFSTTLD